MGLFRFRGLGLGNALFPWARCAVVSRTCGLRRLASTWPQIPHDWIHRGKNDRRYYADLFDERRTALTGFSKIRARCYKSIPEARFLRDPTAFSSGVVVFSGMKGCFSSFLHEHAFIRDLLIQSTRAPHRAGLALPPSVSIHVRLGDFHVPSADAAATPFNTRQPISWYVHALRQIRALAPDAPVHVFSDGEDRELSPLLAFPGVRRVTFGSSIADLLALSTAAVMIGSRSTFSMWGAWLGQMPAIWPRFAGFQAFHPQQPEYEVQLGYDALPEPTCALIRARLSSLR